MKPARNILTTGSSEPDAFRDYRQADQQAQTTIRQPVRVALGANEGDELACAIEDGRGVITKASPRLPRTGDPLEEPLPTFGEWNTQEDADAFR